MSEKENRGEGKKVNLVVKSKIKEAVPGLNVAGEVGEALNETVREMLEKAAERAKKNGRRTLYARDL